MSEKEQIKTELITICLADVKAEQIEWLWPNRIPMGKVTLIIGDPGLGKSLLTIYIAAIVTTGNAWPDLPKENANKGSVILLTAEDDIADTVRPRMDAAGADPKKVEIIKCVEVDIVKNDNRPQFFCIKAGVHLAALCNKM
jgi:putative DNA primase/helicase